MSDPTFELFDEYAARFARGERPDVTAYLEQAGAHEGELARLIDRFLQLAPPPPPDEGTVEAFQHVASALRSGRSPVESIRIEKGIQVEQIVDSLIDTHALDPTKRSKVRRYYELLEQGILPWSRINRSIRDTMRRVLGLRPQDDLIFSTRQPVHVWFAVHPLHVPAAERDEIDDLFLGTSEQA